MKASSPRVAILLTLLVLCGTLLTGCGVASKNVALTQGNWSMLASSTKSAGTFTLGGNLTQNKASVSGTVYITGSAKCFAPGQAVTITGKVSGAKLKLTSESIVGQVITINASGSASVLSGTYAVVGGCSDGDQGSIVANAVGSVTGTWSGTLLVSGSPATMTVALTQATTASADGTFALTGTVTYIGAVCPATALTGTSSIAGGILAINTDSSVSYSPTVDNIMTPANMTGDYDDTSDPCTASGGIQTVTLTKQ